MFSNTTTMSHHGTSLYDLLSNSLILLEICPQLPLTSILALTCTSKALNDLFSRTPEVYRRLDLSCIRCRCSRRPCETVAEFSCRPLNERCVDEFSTVSFLLHELCLRNKLQQATKIILDGLFVPTSAMKLLLCDESYNVRLLSICGCFISSECLQELVDFLRSAAVGERVMPKLRGLYMFGPEQQRCVAHVHVDSRDASEHSMGVMSSPGAQLGAFSSDFWSNTADSPVNSVLWYDGKGQMALPGMDGFPGKYEIEWEELVHTCAGTIAFDIVSCRHCHMSTDNKALPPRLATVSLKGCKSCGSCPEGPAMPGISPTSHLPLIAPVPLHSSSVRAAQMPPVEGSEISPLIARCMTCLKDRWCKRCNAWWCESCYTPPRGAPGESEGPEGLPGKGSVKVHFDLCVERCLVSELYSGAGEGGMWG